MTRAQTAASRNDAPPRAPAGEASCFHCDQPLDPTVDASAEVLGHRRAFCCHGCRAVALAIVDAGLEDYYAHRQGKAVTADVVPEILRKLPFYDHPEVQRSFVRDRGPAREASLLLENIRCAACLWLNERVLRGLDGVIDVEMDYASHHARVRWDPERITLSAILEQIMAIGYLAHPYDPARREELQRVQRRRSSERLIFAGVIGMMVMNFAIAGYVMGLGDETGELSLWTLIGRWTSLFATTAILAYPGQEFFLGAWRDLRNRRLGMDVPIALGLSIAYLGSLHATVTRVGEVYYDSIAMFVFLVLLARRIELRGRVRAADALDRVERIMPRLASRLGPDGTREVLVTELGPGDRVLVRPGERVPCDGRLIESAGSFDESLLTGEPLPVARAAGDEVIGGSCNIDQPVVIEVARAHGESTLGEIHRLLAGGMREAPRYALLAQRGAAWFVAGVLLVAVFTAGAWLLLDPAAALPNTVAVLIVTCPCAFALAAPVANAIGVGRLADRGLLVTRGEAVERLPRCELFAFDKTGTLTSGELQIESVHPFGGLDADSAFAAAAALEAGSEHPVGRAIRAARPAPLITATDIHNRVGQGMSGRLGSTTWRIGRPDFALGPDQLAAQRHAISGLSGVGRVLVALGSDDGRGALFVLRDELRPGARELAGRLRARGARRLALLSGDDPAAVAELGRALGFDEFIGGMSPADKLAWIRAQQEAGAQVAMIGDGINDAPTLAAADVSLSFAQATELAQVHSGLLILRGDLGLVEQAIAVTAGTRRIIRQNLAWAAAYNFLAVPAAAMGLIAPWGAAIGMSLSSLFVVLNALRLNRQTLKTTS